MEYRVLKDWVTKEGLRAVVIETSMGHNCGYIGVDKDNSLYGKSYSQHCDCLMELRDNALKGEIGKRGIIDVFCYDGESATMGIVFNVHGGVTYTGGDDDYPVKSELWWIGYDCNHCDDTPFNQDLDYCINECEELSRQISEVK